MATVTYTSFKDVNSSLSSRECRIRGELLIDIACGAIQSLHVENKDFQLPRFVPADVGIADIKNRDSVMADDMRFIPGRHYYMRGQSPPPNVDDPDIQFDTVLGGDNNAGGSAGQAKSTSANEIDADREARDTFRNLAAGQHHAVDVLHELSDTLRQIILPRGQSRERSRDASVASHRSRVDDRHIDYEPRTLRHDKADKAGDRGDRYRPQGPRFMTPEIDAASADVISLAQTD